MDGKLQALCLATLLLSGGLSVQAEVIEPDKVPKDVNLGPMTPYGEKLDEMNRQRIVLWRQHLASDLADVLPLPLAREGWGEGVLGLNSSLAV